jgi:hypothetical protein
VTLNLNGRDVTLQMAVLEGTGQSYQQKGPYSHIFMWSWLREWGSVTGLMETPRIHSAHLGDCYDVPC